MKKLQHKYFVCPKIKILLSETSCHFNRNKMKPDLSSETGSRYYSTCSVCPKEFPNSRKMFTEEQILQGEHRSDLEKLMDNVKATFSEFIEPVKENNSKIYGRPRVI